MYITSSCMEKYSVKGEQRDKGARSSRVSIAHEGDGSCA